MSLSSVHLEQFYIIFQWSYLTNPIKLTRCINNIDWLWILKLQDRTVKIFKGYFPGWCVFGFFFFKKGVGNKPRTQRICTFIFRTCFDFFHRGNKNIRIFLKLQKIPFWIISHYSETIKLILNNLSKITLQTKMSSGYISQLTLPSSNSPCINWALDTMLNWNVISLMWRMFNDRVHSWINRTGEGVGGIIITCLSSQG